MSKEYDLRLYEQSGKPRTIRMDGYAPIAKNKALIAKDATGKPSICHTRERAMELRKRGQKVVKLEVLVRIWETR